MRWVWVWTLALGACSAPVAVTTTPDAASDAVPRPGDAGVSDDAACGYDGGPPCGFVESRFSSNFGCNAGGASGGLALAMVSAGVLCRRRRRRGVAALLIATAAGISRAEPPPKEADASIEPEAPPPRRWLAITNDPIGFLLIDRWGGNVEVVPTSHHGIILSPFYVSTTGTERTNFPHFTGWGGEIGYRYYFGVNGPRGVFINPSLLLGKYTGTPGVGDSVSYDNLGGALDAGFQSILWDRLVVALGIGVQATWASHSFPMQDLPVSIYANSGIRGRFFTAVGVAF